MRNKTFASELSRERCTLYGSLEMKQGSGNWLVRCVMVRGAIGIRKTTKRFKHMKTTETRSMIY